jgi:hypothetical protein
MKFTQNTSIMNPNTINAQYRAVTDPMAYGTAGKEYAAMAGAVGQVVKFAQQEQDARDATKVMSTRNDIMGDITKSLYGENGIMTLGVGKNAEGLTDRVTQTIQKIFDNHTKKLPSRLRRGLQGNLNENMANYQRLAGQQEGREYVKMQDVNYASGQNMNVDRMVSGYMDDNTLEITLNDSLRMLNGYGALKGWSGRQIQDEQRKLISSLAGSSIQAAMDNGDLTRADILNQRYGPYMDQTTRMKFDVALKKNSDIQQSRIMGGDLIKKFGKNKQAAYDYVFNDLAKQTVTVSSGGAYFSDAGVNDEIMAAAKEFNVDPALVAAIAQAESNGRQSAVSGVGALGVMQLMPDTAASLGVDPNNRKDNIRGGAKYLRQMLDTFGGDLRKAVAAYNAGPGAVKQYGGVPPYKETQNYVAKILDGTPDSGEAFYSAKKRVGGATVKPYQMPTQGASIDEQVGNLKDTWKHGVMDWVGGVVKDVFHYSNPTISSAARSSARNAQVSTSGDKSWHVHNDALDVVFDEGQNLSQKEKDALVKYFKDTGMFSEVLYHNYGSGWHLHLGGLKSSNPPQGGGGSYSKRKYSEAQLQAIYRQYEAQLSDQIQTENFQKQEQAKSYIEGLKGLGSQSDVLAYLDKVKASTDVQTYNHVAAAAHSYYPDYFAKGRSGGSGSRRSRVYYNGDDGRQYTQAKVEWAQDVYNEYLDDENITEAEQKRYNKATRILTAIGYGKGDNLDNPMAFTVAKQAWDQTQDYNKAHKWLRDVYGFSFNEATYYLDHLD